MKEQNQINITFLGPIGGTFSGSAYNDLSKKYGVPASGNLIPATTNGEIIKMIIAHGGYGAIAMETLAEARVTESLESFIRLLKDYETKNCPIKIIGAIRKKLHFCLMKNKLANKSDISGVIAHPKAIGACKENINRLGLSTFHANSNGEAVSLIANDDKFKNHYAIGPYEASVTFGVEVVNTEFEDQEAFTTFFLIGPNTGTSSTGERNRVLLMFEIPHLPGALSRVLNIISNSGFNLTQIHSAHCGNSTYHFVIEIEFEMAQIPEWEKTYTVLKGYLKRELCFGPFEIRNVS